MYVGSCVDQSGVCAIFGLSCSWIITCFGLYALQLENSTEVFKVIHQTDLISTVKTLLAERQAKLSNMCPWLLGQMYLASGDVTDNKSSGYGCYFFFEL